MQDIPPACPRERIADFCASANCQRFERRAKNFATVLAEFQNVVHARITAQQLYTRQPGIADVLFDPGVLFSGVGAPVNNTNKTQPHRPAQMFCAGGLANSRANASARKRPRCVSGGCQRWRFSSPPGAAWHLELVYMTCQQKMPTLTSGATRFPPL